MSSVMLLLVSLASGDIQASATGTMDELRLARPGVSWLSRDWDLVTADKTIVIPSPGWSQRIIINIHTNIINLIVSCYRAQIQWHAQITLRQTLSQPNNKIRESSKTIQNSFKLENIKTLLAPPISPRCHNVGSVSAFCIKLQRELKVP